MRKDRKSVDLCQNSLSESKTIPSSSTHSNKTSFGTTKSSSNKYTDETNKSFSVKRSSITASTVSQVGNNEEYDPEDALYSSEHLVKKPKLEHMSTRLPTSKTNMSLNSSKINLTTTKYRQSLGSKSNNCAPSPAFNLSKSMTNNNSNDVARATKNNTILDFLDL